MGVRSGLPAVGPERGYASRAVTRFLPTGSLDPFLWWETLPARELTPHRVSA